MEQKGESSKTVLYSYWRSSCSWRARLVLSLKNIEFEYKYVHLIKDGGEQHKKEYTDLNPMHFLPTLIIDGVVIGQSLAIMEYLEETRPQVPLLPKDPKARAQVRQIMYIIACDIQPIQNLKTLNRVAEISEQQKGPWATKTIVDGLAAVEKLLEKFAGKYCVGDEITFADVALVPQVYGARRWNVDMSQFPIISRIDAALQDHEVFKACHADSQADAVK
eukprot:TRINITY_DN20509_c0_g1_i1.p1 TRINITY_DN20509_c0_g1~~TRINITY_DN20509_c0_g1_i1.p1  ORF type:complete len:220 (-),score=39.96 TRINITY_DN20509_c0_g1_i1:24-683(-)